MSAWAIAPDAEKAARFAAAEAMRWLEWGARTYEHFTVGLPVLFAAAVVRTAFTSRPIGYLMGLSGLTYVVQRWLAGAEGLSRAHTSATVIAEVLNAVWMTWLLVLAWRIAHAERASDVR